jgi:hypothetical protein
MDIETKYCPNRQLIENVVQLWWYLRELRYICARIVALVASELINWLVNSR